jgi:hypothetical protein
LVGRSLLESAALGATVVATVENEGQGTPVPIFDGKVPVDNRSRRNIEQIQTNLMKINQEAAKVD